VSVPLLDCRDMEVRKVIESLRSVGIVTMRFLAPLIESRVSAREDVGCYCPREIAS